MKILYDYQIFNMQKYGGISRYFYEIISRLLRESQCSIDFFQGFNINKYGLERQKNEYNRYFGCGRKIIPKTGQLFNKLNYNFLKCFTAFQEYDIYHPTYYEDLATTNNMVVTVYDMIHELFKEEFLGDKTSEQKKRLLNQAKGIIAISQSTKNDIINLLGIDEKKIKVIYLANSLKSEVCLPPIIKNPYLLYVGGRKGYKNFSTLVKAFAHSKLNKEFFLVCFGGGIFTKEENELLFKLKMQNRVIQCNGDDNVLSNLYFYSDLFVYPSKYEGFGIPPLEAMYYGTPVAASNVSSIPEVIGNAGVYFNPNDEEDVCEKIENILMDSNLKSLLINYGFKREKQFSWDKCVEDTLKYYQYICLK